MSHPHLRCDSRCLNQERRRTLQATRSSVESCLICTASILPFKLMTATNIPLGKNKFYRMSINQKPSKTIKNHQLQTPSFHLQGTIARLAFATARGHGRNGSRHGVLSWHRIRWDFPQGFPTESPAVWCRKVALPNLPCFCHVPYIRFKNHDVDPIVLSERPQNTDDFFWAKVMLVISRPVFWKMWPKKPHHWIFLSSGVLQASTRTKMPLETPQYFLNDEQCPTPAWGNPEPGISRLERAANVAAKMTGFHGPP